MITQNDLTQLNKNLIIKVTREVGTSFIRLSDVVYGVRIGKDGVIKHEED